MLGSDFYAYVLRKFKREDKETEFYEACTDVIADMRLQYLSEDYKEEAYITGINTLGDYRIALPSDVGHVMGEIEILDTENNTTYTPLRRISKTDYDRKYTDRLSDNFANMNSSVPREFCIYANQLYLGPVPDKTSYSYNINYTTEDFTEITPTTVDVPYSGKYRNVLRSGVLAELYNGMEEFEEGEFWQNKFLEGLGKIATNDTDNVADTASVSFSDI